MIVNDKVIAVPLPADKKAYADIFPKKHIKESNGTEYLIVPKRMDYALELKRLGLTKAKLAKNFKFTGKFQPYDHQQITVEFLIANPRSFCLNDMGTGKTASCIWAAEFLRQSKLIKRVLIVSLISCMRSVWDAELFGIHMHQRSVGIAYGTPEYRKSIIEDEPDYIVINPDGIGLVLDALKKYKPDLIIIDEASAYKHPNTKKYKAMQQLIQEDTRVWLLTGTPTAVAPTDIYGLVKLVNPHAMSQSAAMFKNEVMIRIGNFKWVPKQNAIDTVLQYMQPAVRFDKKDCLDMPPVTYVYRETQLTKEQRKAFDAMRLHLRYERANGAQIDALNAAVKIVKLAQICMGVVYDNEGNHQYLDASHRLDTLREVIDEAGDKCVIFVPYKGVIKDVTKFLQDKCKLTTEMVTGDTSAGERTRIFDAFQNGMFPQHLLAHPKVTSHGINLTRSHNTVWYGPYRNPEAYIQANNRMDRPGQTHAVTITRIFADPFEKKMYEALESQQRFQDTILDIYAELTE